MSENQRYACVKVPVPPGTVIPEVRVEVVESHPEVVKSVTKRCVDGRTLFLHVVDDVIKEKHLNYSWPWDYDALKQEKEKGGKVSFKCFERHGLEIGLTYYGTYLVTKTFTLTAKCRKKFPQFFPTNWHDELHSEIPFPGINVDRIELVDGYSIDRFENKRMAGFFEEDILNAMERNDEKNREIDEVVDVIANTDNTDDTACEYCAQSPCVWLQEEERVFQVDMLQHAGTLFTSNSICRKVAFKHMWRVMNGIGQNGVRTRHPECVEMGVRAAFPDSEFMGFREA
jgi:hypothetical protein